MTEIEAIVRQLALPIAGKSLLSTITNHNTIRQHTNRIQENHEEILNANEKILLLESKNTFLKRENVQLKRRISQLQSGNIANLKIGSRTHLEWSSKILCTMIG